MLNILTNIGYFVAIVIALLIVCYWIALPLIVDRHLRDIQNRLKEKQKTDQQILEELTRIRKACESKTNENI